jgi:hypothetical protein
MDESDDDPSCLSDEAEEDAAHDDNDECTPPPDPDGGLLGLPNELLFIIIAYVVSASPRDMANMHFVCRRISAIARDRTMVKHDVFGGFSQYLERKCKYRTTIPDDVSLDGNRPVWIIRIRTPTYVVPRLTERRPGRREALCPTRLHYNASSETLEIQTGPYQGGKKVMLQEVPVEVMTCRDDGIEMPSFYLTGSISLQKVLMALNRARPAPPKKMAATTVMFLAIYEYDSDMSGDDYRMQVVCENTYRGNSLRVFEPPVNASSYAFSQSLFTQHSFPRAGTSVWPTDLVLTKRLIRILQKSSVPKTTIVTKTSNGETFESERQFIDVIWKCTGGVFGDVTYKISTHDLMDAIGVRGSTTLRVAPYCHEALNWCLDHACIQIVYRDAMVRRRLLMSCFATMPP